MCMQAKCPTCSYKTWTGCGSHIPSVMERIPKAEWCKCTKPEGSPYPPQRSMGFGCVIL
ncbi:hypothetical protein DFP73DRAFT_472339 [Morchella snyderi]|nr:hypothetical protein DFP73DRAFT_472339 [Morchella snyderi]